MYAVRISILNTENIIGYMKTILILGKLRTVKMWLVFTTIILLGFPYTIMSESNKVHITKNDELNDLLCNQTLHNDTILLLYPDITHEIQDHGFCVINMTYSLTIQSNSDTLYAVIQCNATNNGTFPTTGFAFSRTPMVKFQNLIFKHCGASLNTLKKDILQYINSTDSVMYFTKYHAATLLFSGIYRVELQAVIFNCYYGFAILGYNVQNASLSQTHIHFFEHHIAEIQRNHTVGSGILFLYQDNLHHTSPAEMVVTIKKCLFSNNFENIDYITCVKDRYTPDTFNVPTRPVINAAGLSLLYVQQTFSVKAEIMNSTFTNNVGSLCGALLVLYLNTSTSITVIGDSYFNENRNFAYHCHGSAIIFFTFWHNHDPMSCLLQIFNSTFYRNGLPWNSASLGAVYIAVLNSGSVPIYIYFKNVTFIENRADWSGSAVFAVSYQIDHPSIVTVILESVKAIENIHSGGPLPINGIFRLSFIDNVVINGSHSNPGFFSNNYGSVIEVFQYSLNLQGYLIFENNKGISGSAINLVAGSLLHLNEGLNCTFTNNTAQLSGGAINAVNNIYGDEKCAFQFHFDFNTTPSNISLFFEGNTAAQTGNSVYATNLYYCKIYGKKLNDKQLMKLYEQILRFSSKGSMSSTPHDFYVCLDAAVNTDYTFLTYPGKTLQIPVNSTDYGGNNVFTSITISKRIVEEKRSHQYIEWWISENEKLQIIQESPQCTMLNITIYSHSRSAFNGTVILSLPTNSTMKSIYITVNVCPPGFILNSTGSCVCSPEVKLVNRLASQSFDHTCDINSGTIRRPSTYSWAGVFTLSDNGTKIHAFGISLYCHYAYCNNNDEYDLFYFKAHYSYLLKSSNHSPFNNISICQLNRDGIMCSKCVTTEHRNYSVVFGSTNCLYCDNKWIWTILLYIVAGPLLVYLLLVLKLTLTTGTLNGIIFYAQAANAGITYTLLIQEDGQSLIHHIFTMLGGIFLSTLNLNLGFPLCFYNGMTEIWKTGLSLLFPIYLLTIVVLLIILSRYSTWISNRISHSSIQVLVTVVHLSFSKLLLMIVDVFSYAVVYTNTSSTPLKVWYNDGTVIYGSYEHMTLMIVTSIIVGALLVPYIIILIGGQALMKSGKVREYLRPIHEAIHAPYKDNKKYWFTARLLLLTLIYIVYTMLRGHNILAAYAIALPTVLLFITAQAYSKPFKSKVINVLDLSIMVNYALMINSIIYYSSAIKATTLLIVLINLVLLTFFIVILYHVLWIAGYSYKIKENTYHYLSRITNIFNSWFGRKKTRRNRAAHQDIDNSFFHSCSDAREPLLSSTLHNMS